MGPELPRLQFRLRLLSHQQLLLWLPLLVFLLPLLLAAGAHACVGVHSDAILASIQALRLPGVLMCNGFNFTHPSEDLNAILKVAERAAETSSLVIVDDSLLAAFAVAAQSQRSMKSSLQVPHQVFIVDVASGNHGFMLCRRSSTWPLGVGLCW